MNIAILSQDDNIHSTERLVQAAKEIGHNARVINPLMCDVVLNRHYAASVNYNYAPLAAIDVVLPRIGPAITSYGLTVVYQFEAMGVPVVNGGDAIARSRNKLRCLQLLSQQGIPFPKTVLSREPDNLSKIMELVGGAPVVLKLIEGMQGAGVMLAETSEAAESILEAMWVLRQNVLIQEFIAESKGRDLRAMIVGGEIIAAMRRQAKAGEFRANIHRGGRGEAVELTSVHQRIAIEATEAVGLRIAGVDMLETNEGPMVIEINSSPGIEGIEEACRVDVARKMIDYSVKFAEEAKGIIGDLRR